MADENIEGKVNEEDSEVVLHKETYADAIAGNQCVADLEHISMVHVEHVLLSDADKGHQVKAINNHLRKAARALGATHVFGVEYMDLPYGFTRDVIAYGDAYGQAQCKGFEE